MDELVGQRYRLETLLGQGGLSTVYRAVDTQNADCPVVLKFLRLDATARGAESTLRFLREARLLTSLSHPRIVELMELGQSNDCYYLVTRYFERGTLGGLLAGGRHFSFQEVLAIAVQIAEALDYVHLQGIIHRDVKPSNVLISSDLPNLGIKVADFGLARLQDVSRASLGEEEVVGTFAYIAPEQTGALPRAVDERSDLYSMGVLIYEMLTGRRPYQPENLAELLHMQLTREPEPIRELRQDTPEVLERLVLKLLSKDPEDRYPSAGSLLADLMELEQRIQRGEDETSFTLGTYRRARFGVRTRLVGRERELEELQEGVVKAVQGWGGLWLVSGQAGSGKTRLLDELIPFATLQKVVFLTGRAHQYARQFPYNAIVEAVNDLVSRTDQLESRPLWETKIREAAGPFGQVLLKILPTLKEILGDQPPLPVLDPEREHLRFLQALSSFLVRLPCDGLPVVIFLDDLQWADEGTLGVLEEVVSLLKEVPLMIVMTYREEEIPEGSAVRRCLQELEKAGEFVHRIDLGPFDLKKTEQFCAESLGFSSLEISSLVRDLWEQSGGNPFFLTELLKSCIHNEILTVDSGKWRYLPADRVRMPGPLSVIDSVLKRVREVSPETRRVLGYASLLGREFTFEKLQLITQITSDEVLNALDEGLREHILWENRKKGQGVYQFFHDRIHEGFYQSLDPAVRVRYHAEIAHRIERESPDDLFAIAHHYAESGEREKSLHYCRHAGERAQAAYANDEARYFYRKALEALERKDLSQEIEIQERLADIDSWTGQFQSAIQTYEKILSALGGERRIVIEGKIAWTIYRSGDSKGAMERYYRLFRLLGIWIAPTRQGFFTTLLKQGFVRLICFLFPFIVRLRRIPNTPMMQERLGIMFRGIYTMYLIDMKMLVPYLLRILNIAERVGPNPVLAYTLSGYGIMVSSIPLFWLSHAIYRRAERIWEKLGDPWGKAQIKSFHGLIFSYEAKFETANRLLEEAAETLLALGDSLESTIPLYQLGYIHILMGRFDEAESYLNKALRITERVQDDRTTSFSLSFLSWLLILQGREREAEEAALRAVRLAEKSGATAMLQEAWTVLGKVRLSQGRIHEAVELFEKTVQWVRTNHLRADYIALLYEDLAQAYVALARKDRSWLSKARRSCRSALFYSVAFRNYLTGACRIKACLEWNLGHRRRARWWLERGLGAARKSGRRHEEAQTLALRGRWFENRDDLETARQMFEETGAKPALEQVRRELSEKTAGDEARPLLPHLELEALLEASRLISSELSLENLLEKIMDKSIQVMRAERGYLMLYEHGRLIPKVIRVVQGSIKEQDLIAASNSVVSEVERTRNGMVVIDAQMDPRLKEQLSVVRGRLRSILAVPLIVRDRFLGVLYVDNRMVSGLYTKADLQILSAFAVQAAISIENAIAFKKVEEQVRFQTQELEAANRKLGELSDLKSQLMSMASHDLRGPLSAIRDCLALMVQDLGAELTEDRLSLVKIGEKSVERMLMLINELLDFNRIEAEGIKLNKKQYDLAEIVRDEVDLLKPEALQKGVKFSADRPPHPMIVNMDPARITQVFDNLLRNALRYTPAGGEISISLQDSGGEIVCSVRDTGPGIAPENLPRLFGQFAKFGKAGGLGLGLFISKKFVEMHGGRIWAESPAGNGASFFFSLPR